jgi:hypothetical protein
MYQQSHTSDAFSGPTDYFSDYAEKMKFLFLQIMQMKKGRHFLLYISRLHFIVSVRASRVLSFLNQ